MRCCLAVFHREIKDKFDQTDKDHGGDLDFKEIKALLKKLNIKEKDKVLKQKFDEVQMGSGDATKMDLEEFKVFLESLFQHPAVDELFNKLRGKHNVATAEDFQKFLVVQGHPNATLDEAKALIAKLERPREKGPATELTSAGFMKYFLDTRLNSLFNPAHEKIYQPMDQPMAHYWISSSHNTYLMGHQLTGESSTQAYINAFKIGCRCVELDCWDSPEGVVIYHGHTLTTKIFFKDVIEAVRDHAFMNTDAPCVLSLEMHCGVEGQNQIAKMIQDTLGPAGFLIEEPVEKTGLMGPGKYMKKVLLKGKMTPFLEEEDEDPAEEADTPAPVKKGGKAEAAAPAAVPEDAKKKKPEKTSEELSALTTFSACSFKGFGAAKEKKAFEMSSFSENKVKSLLKKSPIEFIDYNSHHVARVYPKGTRFDSSNYDPVPSWNCGAQMVALNHQTGTEPLWINHGRFLDNGASGYILKPEFLRKPELGFNPVAPRKAAKTLHLTVLGAWQLPKKAGSEKEENTKGNVVNPYVVVKCRGVPKDEFQGKTGTVKRNGFNPAWKKEFKIPLTVPELATVLFVVMNDVLGRDDFVAQYAINVNNIRPGFHMVPLKDQNCLVYDKAALLISARFQ